MTPSDAASESRIARALRAVTATMHHHDTLMEQSRTLYRRQQHPLHTEPRVMHWIDRYLRFYDSKPLYHLDARHATVFLSFVVTEATQDEAEGALRFFHETVLLRPLPKTLDYRVGRSPLPAPPDPAPIPTNRTLWPSTQEE